MESPRSVSSAESRPKVPTSITNLSREELEKTAHNFYRKLKQKDKELKEYEKRLSSISEDKNTEHESQLAAHRHEKARLEESCALLTHERDAAQHRHQDVERELERVNAELHQSQLTLEEVMGEKNGTMRILRELQDEDQALQQQVSTLKEAITAAVEERDASYMRLAEERDRCALMEATLSDAQKQLRAYDQEAQELQQSKDGLEEAKAQLMENENQLQLALDKAKEEQDELMRTANKESLQLAEEKEKLSNELVHVKEQLLSCQSFEARLKTATERIEELEKELHLMKSAGEGEKGEKVPIELFAELESRSEKYRERIATLENDNTVLQAQLKEEQEGKKEIQCRAEEQLETIQKEMAGTEEKLHMSMEQAEKIKKVLERTEAEVDSQKTAVERFQSELNTERTQVDSLKQECISLKAKLVKVESVRMENAEMTSTIEKLKEERDSLDAQLGHATKEEQLLKDSLLQSEQRLADVQVEMKTLQQNYDEQLKALRAELKKSQKSCYTAEDRVNELEAEITQHKVGLTKTAARLEEETQGHRIAAQRLQDEQETSQHLKSQLQEALSKIQAAEVETWKQKEADATRHKETEEGHLKMQEELRAEMMALKNQLAAQQQVIADHDEEVEKIKESSEAEKEKLKRAIGELKKRLDRASAQLKKTELDAAEVQTSHDTEKEQLETQVSHHQHQSEKIAVELRDYKAKAHLLVKTKEQELNTLKAELQHRTDVEVDLKVMREKFDDLSVERNNLKEELMQANENFQSHLDDLVAGFQAQIDDKTHIALQAQSQIEALHQAMNEWKLKAEACEREVQSRAAEIKALQEEKAALPEIVPDDNDLEKCRRSLEQKLQSLQEEFASYKRTSEQMAEVQQVEMSRLIQSNIELRRLSNEDNASSFSAAGRHSFDRRPSSKDLTARLDHFQLSDLLHGQEGDQLHRIEDGESLSESQIVALANKQAQREDTIQALKKQNVQMRSDMEDLEKELELHREQEKVLKAYLREADQFKQQLKAEPPESMDFQYLKNTVMKLITTGEAETLLPVFAKLLNFTEEEMTSLTDAVQASKRASVTEDTPTASGLLSSLTGFSWL